MFLLSLATILAVGYAANPGKAATRISPVYTQYDFGGVAPFNGGYLISGEENYFSWDLVGTPVKLGHSTVGYLGGNSAGLYTFIGEKNYEYWNGEKFQTVNLEMKGSSYPYSFIAVSEELVLVYNLEGEAYSLTGATFSAVNASSPNSDPFTVFVPFRGTIYAAVGEGQSLFVYRGGSFAPSGLKVKLPVGWGKQKGVHLEQFSDGYLYGFEARENLTTMWSPDGQTWSVASDEQYFSTNAVDGMCCTEKGACYTFSVEGVQKWNTATKAWDLDHPIATSFAIGGIICDNQAVIAYGTTGYLAYYQNNTWSDVYNGFYAPLGDVRIFNGEFLVRAGVERLIGRPGERLAVYEKAAQVPVLRGVKCGLIPSAERPQGAKDDDTCQMGCNSTHVVFTLDFKTITGYPVPLFTDKAFVYRAIVHKGKYIIIEYDRKKQKSAYITASSPLPPTPDNKHYNVENTTDFALREILSNGNIVVMYLWDIDTYIWTSPDGYAFSEIYSGSYDTGNVYSLEPGRDGEFIMKTMGIMHEGPHPNSLISADGLTIRNVSLPDLLPVIVGYSEPIGQYIVSALGDPSTLVYVRMTRDFKTFTEPAVLGNSGQLATSCQGLPTPGKDVVWCVADLRHGLWELEWAQ